MNQTRSSGNEDTLLKVDGICKHFDGVTALDGVKISLERARITLLIGPNGSGKSTLIETITGFCQPDSGNIIFEGEDITGIPPHRIYDLGISRTFQIPRPLRRLTLLENLMVAEKSPGDTIWGSFRRGWLKKEEEIAERAFELLEFLGLDGMWDHPASNLSGGQLKLLELGRALMRDVKLLIMDEPIAGVVPQLAEKLLNYLKDLKKQGITLLLIEHRLDLVLPYVDNIYVISDGRIIAEGREEVLEHPDVIEVYLGA
ncbi:ABC transporter ATP-binding protein [Methanosarcinales archaeon]|nr:MAG: ABC transporter ATP-binding protein [Methanosarcinales archaeon]